MALSDKITALSPSLTLALAEKSRTLIAQGKDLINLSGGESRLHAPIEAQQAAHKAIDNHQSFYTAVEGTYDLRSSIADYLWRHHQLSYQISDIIASTGCKQSLFNLLYVLLNPGDEVLLPIPYWTSYPQMVRACCGVPVEVPTTEEHRFLPTADQLRAKITPRTKVLILNSPNNPSSQVLLRQDLESLANVLIHYPDLWICCDDIYDQLYLDAQAPHLLEVAPELKPRTIVINGVSKSHAMSGWRLGFAAGPTEVIKAMKTLQSQSTSNPCSITQAAAAAALTHGDLSLEKARDFYRAQHHVFSRALKEQLPTLKSLEAQAGFYRWLDLRPFIERGGWGSDLAFAEDFLGDLHVSGVPGSAFGQEGFLRVSVTEPAERLEEALSRLQAFLQKRKAL